MAEKDSSWKEMFSSIWKEKGNSFIQFLLDGGLDVNAWNKYGKTMLSYAAEWGNLETVEFLARKGAYVNMANSDGSKPLHIAAQYGHKNIVKFFLDRRVSANSCDNDGCTPLHYISCEPERNISPESRASYQEIVHLLVNRDADLNALDRKGRTPLVHAAQHYRKHIIELLIQLGGNLKICNDCGFTVPHFAALFGWSGIMRFIVEGRFEFDPDARLSNGETPLLLAARKSHKDIVDLFIELGANVAYCCEEGWTVLHHSCEYGWLDVVKYIVSTGCDLNGETSDRCTPLLRAAKNKYCSIVEYLVESGSNLNCVGYTVEFVRNTVLHFACQNGWFDAVVSLIKKGSYLDAQNDWDDTPLHYAVNNRNFKIAKLLLEAGANWNLENCFATTAFSYCIYKCHLKAIKLFIENGAFLQSNDYNHIMKNYFLKKAILQNIEVCTQAIINRFNNLDLHRIYEIPVRLPAIEKLRIASNRNVAQDIAETVKYEIQIKGYCDLLNARPSVLSMLCVRSLVEYNDKLLDKNF